MPRPFASSLVSILLAVLLATWSAVEGKFAHGAESGEAFPAALRRPAALALSEDQRWLYVAQQRTGAVSAIDLTSEQVASEVAVGKRLSSLARAKDGLLLATDEQAHQLIALRVEGQQVEVVERIAVPPYPVNVAVHPDGSAASVTSLWSRRVTHFALAPTSKDDQPATIRPTVAQVIDLPFAPREQVWLQRGERLLVADAFAGRLAIIDPAAGKLLFTRDIPAHNIRGLALRPDGQMLCVAHQMLNELAHTTSNDIHWGLLMSNDLRWIAVDKLLDPAADLYEGAHMHPIGEPNRGSGDLSAVAVSSRGIVVAAAGGTGEIAFGEEREFTYRRVRTGVRPTAIVIDRDGERAFVADAHGDAVHIVRLADKKPVARRIALGPQPPLTAVDRGELLFYSGRLSHDGWMSCHSCHTDGHANGQLNDNFSDESFGAPKRVLSLLGVKDTAPYAWNGQRQVLADQVRASIRATMQGRDDPSDEQVADLTTFMESLTPPPPVDLLRGTRDEPAVARGENLFAELRCVRCHAPPTYTSPKTYDVGLVDQQGNRRFNPPSLRGVGQRAPLFHDGSAMDVDEVIGREKHKLPRALTDDERRDLAAFLKSL